MIKSLTLSTTKYIVNEIILDFVKFPVWWYSRGLILAAERFLRHLNFGLQLTGLKIWLQSLFKPMYSDTTIQGRLISFFMRLILLIAKIIAMIFILLFAIIIFLLWLALPPIVVYLIYRQLS